MQHSRVPIVVLGATGMVGQRAVCLLADHPFFDLVALAASPRSVGKSYRQACRWQLPSKRPCAETIIQPCDPAILSKSSGGPGIAISALDAKAAKDIEPMFAQAGWLVVSNASAFRGDPTVPLVIPEVNPDHLALVLNQGTPGAIVTNPNCTSIPLVLGLAALRDKLGIDSVFLASYQAVSGAGYPGESAWDMIGNVHPHASNEEEKVQSEPLKILGSIAENLVKPAAFPISARCVRVPVADGHLIAVSVRTKKPCTPAEAIAIWQAWNRERSLDLPTAPNPAIHLREERDRPSPRWDADTGGGMALTIGRVEPCPIMGLKFFALAHNTVRGAAGAAVLNAELLVTNGWWQKLRAQASS